MPTAIRNIEFNQYNVTFLNPIALIFTLVMGLLILVVKKKYIILMVINTVLFIPYIQRIVISGVDLDMVRVVILFGLLRIFIRPNEIHFRLTDIDRIFLFYVIVKSITYILLRRDMSAVINRFGFVFNAIGVFLLMKISINDYEDAYTVIKYLIIISIPITLAMIIEQITQRNLFSIFGGVPQYTIIRDGRLRSQAAFAHAIHAGTFGAMLIPYSWGLWSKEKISKKIAIVGFITGTIITITSSSSGPIMSYVGGLIALTMWFIRKKMKIVRWSLIICIITLHLVMKAPVWALLARVDVISGSTGYHRFNLVDQFIKRFNEWWVLGLESTAHWGWGLQDVTNMYVRVGIDGGLISLILFILLITISFKTVGQIIRDHEKNGSKNIQILIWAVGSVLFVHVISFLGVSYFGNMIYFFYLPIFLLSSLKYSSGTIYYTNR